MAIIIDTKRHKDFLEIIVTGSYDLNQAINKFSQIYLYCNIAGLQKVLIDYRELQKNTGDTEKYLFGAGIADSYNNYLSSGGMSCNLLFSHPQLLLTNLGSKLLNRQDFR